MTADQLADLTARVEALEARDLARETGARVISGDSWASAQHILMLELVYSAGRDSQRRDLGLPFETDRPRQLHSVPLDQCGEA